MHPGVLRIHPATLSRLHPDLEPATYPLLYRLATDTERSASSWRVGDLDAAIMRSGGADWLAWKASWRRELGQLEALSRSLRRKRRDKTATQAERNLAELCRRNLKPLVRILLAARTRGARLAAAAWQVQNRSADRASECRA